MRKGVTVALAVAVVAVVAGLALGGWSVAVSGSTSAGKVGVRLKEWKVAPSVKRVAAGRVVFLVRNGGERKHEFVVIRTNRSPASLPVKGGRATESGKRGEVEDLRPDAAGRLTLALKRGRYVLICNLRGHYKHGMFVAFKVV